MRRLVIVDDEAIVIQGLKAIMDRLGLNVELVGSANNGVDGADIIRQTHPDLVITDIRMPGLDGLSMIEEIHDQLSDVSFVIISGYTDFAYAKKAITLGVVDYIDKPITIEKVSQLFENLDKQNQRRVDLQGESNVRSQGDESVINALMLENAEDFVERTESFLKQAKGRCHSPSEYKEECYRFMCLIQGIYAGHRKHYDDSMLVSAEEIMRLESADQAGDYVRANVHKIASQMEADKKGSSHHVIGQLLQYINENYNRDIGLTELGEKVDMSATYLSILFKKEVGKSYVKYLTELRIQKAKKFLDEGRKVNEVATLVGFNNYRYFCDVFKKHVGKTPSEYRDNL